MLLMGRLCRICWRKRGVYRGGRRNEDEKERAIGVHILLINNIKLKFEVGEV